MGNGASVEEPLNVAVVGMTETGKTHFLSVMENMPECAKMPTYGYPEVTVIHNKRRVRFIEFGAVLADVWRQRVDQLKLACVVWFVDAHDTREEILLGRNMLLHALIPPSPAELATPEDVVLIHRDTCRLPLCIVQNVGRPFRDRHRLEMAHGRWRWAEEPAHITPVPSPCDWFATAKPVTWGELPDVVQLEHLKKLHAAVLMMRMSFTDGSIPGILLDWILQHEPL